MNLDNPTKTIVHYLLMKMHTSLSINNFFLIINDFILLYTLHVI